jgi:integrase
VLIPLPGVYSRTLIPRAHGSTSYQPVTFTCCSATFICTTGRRSFRNVARARDTPWRARSIRGVFSKGPPPRAAPAGCVAVVPCPRYCPALPLTKEAPDMAPRREDTLPTTKSPQGWEALFACIHVRRPTAARNHALLYLAYLAGLRIHASPSQPDSNLR